MFTFLSEKSHIHPGLWGLSTSWRCTADSQTLEWKVLPSHKDCSWSTTVPIQLRMPKKRSGTKDMSVEQIGLFSVKHKAFVITHLWQFENVTIPLLFWKTTSNTLIYPLTSKILTIWPSALAAQCRLESISTASHQRRLKTQKQPEEGAQCALTSLV